MKKVIFMFLILMFTAVGCSASDNTVDGIVIETFPNLDVRAYHLRTQELPETAIKEISEIPGTINDSLSTMGVSFNPTEYRLRVVKGKGFSWDEIEPKVLEILIRHTKGDM